jgi:hypothetical protein
VLDIIKDTKAQIQTEEATDSNKANQVKVSIRGNNNHVNVNQAQYKVVAAVMKAIHIMTQILDVC